MKVKIGFWGFGTKQNVVFHSLVAEPSLKTGSRYFGFNKIYFNLNIVQILYIHQNVYSFHSFGEQSPIRKPKIMSFSTIISEIHAVFIFSTTTK